jgi:hypothetical protein
VKRLVPLSLVLLVLPSFALAARDPHAETEHLNRADMARAKQAAVRKTDLSTGWRLTHSGPPAPGGDQCAGYDPDLSAFIVTGKHETVLEQAASGAGVQSDVFVFRNVRDASRDFKASATRGFLTCLKSVLLKGFRQEHLQAKISSSRMSTTPRVGTQSVFYRVVATISPGNGLPNFPMYADVVAFRQGRSQALLMFTAPLVRGRGQVTLARSVARRMR